MRFLRPYRTAGSELHRVASAAPSACSIGAAHSCAATDSGWSPGATPKKLQPRSVREGRKRVVRFPEPAWGRSVRHLGPFTGDGPSTCEMLFVRLTHPMVVAPTG